MIKGNNNVSKRPEVREKISKKLLGRKRSIDEKRKISIKTKEAMKKINMKELLKKRKTYLEDQNPNWKGGCNDFWHNKAKKIFGISKCEICGKTDEQEKKETGNFLHMHNTLIPKNYTIMNINAWQELCDSCHRTIENKLRK